MANKMSRRTFLRLVVAGVATPAVLGGGGYAYARYVEPYWYEVTDAPLRLDRLDPAFDGYRIVQLSDIHLDDRTTRERLAEIVAQANALAPDLVVVTGDFLSGPRIGRLAYDLIITLRDLNARDGALAILGNRDYWAGSAIVRNVIRQSRMIDVSNAVHTLRRGAAALHIAGVDDVVVGKDRLDLVLDALPETGAAVLLVHEPDFADTSAATGRFDLQISGHSHGGQVVLPVLGRLALPVLARRYPAGLYRVGSMWQYTNRGLGLISPRIRFNCRPEITVFTLRTPQSGS
ncbi:MAG: metallophosphoesterase [Anaerolineae bacterium]|nr:metallophosphoesterase [Anaerolineae bacterium]